VLRAQKGRVKRPVFHSLQEAAEGIKQFWAWDGNVEIDFNPDELEPSGSFRSMYSCFNWYTLSPQLEIHERFGLVVDRLSGGLGPDVGEASRPKEPREPLDCTETAFIQFKNGKRQVTRQKAASYCYGILVTPELRARALRDLEFAVRRWQSRTRRGPLPAQEYPRWSTKFGLGCPEHENKQIVPAYLTDGNPFKWVVRYRGAEATFYRYWNHPHSIVVTRNNRANFVRKLAIDRARIMLRFNQYHPGNLWVLGAPSWTYDLRTPQQSRELQKRDWKSKKGEIQT
jgi:hypothetical protein